MIKIGTGRFSTLPLDFPEMLVIEEAGLRSFNGSTLHDVFLEGEHVGEISGTKEISEYGYTTILEAGRVYRTKCGKLVSVRNAHSMSGRDFMTDVRIELVKPTDSVKLFA